MEQPNEFTAEELADFNSRYRKGKKPYTSVDGPYLHKYLAQAECTVIEKPRKHGRYWYCVSTDPIDS